MLKAKKVISTILIILLVFLTVPANVSAIDIGSNLSDVHDSQSSTGSSKKVSKILKEVTEQRTVDTKRFLKDDGTYEVAEYKIPIHYLDNGKWTDIDNSLEAVTEKDKVGNTSDYLQNKQNDFKVKISKDSASQNLMEIQKDGYNVSWGLADALSTQAVAAAVDEKKLDDQISRSVDDKISMDKELSKTSLTEKKTVKDILVQNAKTETIKNASSTVNFTNVYSNVDLQYLLKGSEVKENIILNSNNDSTTNTTFKFNINAANVIPVLQKDKSIIFYDSKDNTKEIFKVQAPFMYDKDLNMSDKIDVSLIENNAKDGYVLSITPDKAWLKSSERAYPVTIDPSIQTSVASSSIHDTFVASNDTSNKWLNQYLRVGQTPTIGLTRTYMKFDLPSLSSSDMVIDAYFSLFECASESSNNSNQVNVHKVTQNFDPTNINWNTQPSYSTIVEDYKTLNYLAKDDWVSWDVTNIVKGWYNSGTNYGLMLEENAAGHTAFWSSDMDDAHSISRPQVVITYLNNTGLEDYWTYHSQDAGRSGTGYVNDFNGNLTFLHDDLSMNGNKMPVSISHVYNSSLLGAWDRIKPWMGRGWNLNIYQRVDSIKIGADDYWVYTDGDFTKHYFKVTDLNASEVKDELNLGYTFVKEAGGKYYIKDKNDNKVRFYGDGYLYQFVDRNGNAITAVYEQAPNNNIWIITKLVDGAGRTTNLTYDNNGLLSSIKDPAGRETWFGYDTGSYEMLKKITYPDNKVTLFDYDANYNLTGVTNIDGLKINYEYTDNSPKRVKRVYESNGPTLGQEYKMQYGDGSTVFTDVKGYKSTYLFDRFGKTISTKDSDNNAGYYDYAVAKENSTKVSTESKLQKTIINYIQNHDFELNESWNFNTAGAGYTTEDKYMGKQAIKITSSQAQGESYAGQYLTLTKGATYTLSGYVKTQNITSNGNAGAAITISYKDVNGTWKYVRKFINGTTDWQRYEVSFTVPTDISNDSIWVAAEILNSQGTAYFDSLQLEQGSVSNRYNLIENGDFIHWDSITWEPLDWIKNYGCDSGDYVAYSDTTHPQFMDNDVMKLVGKGSANKGIYQNINISGKAKDSYVLSGWAKANSNPIITNRLFQLELGFVKADGSVNWETVPFNSDITEWQFAAGAVIAPEDYVSLRVYISYYQNENTAWFDGIQLNKETFSQSYAYDAKGNVTSTVDLANQSSRFDYSNSNDLLKTTDPKGNNFNYIYYDDGKHNLHTATSAENVVYTFSYDGSGNPLTSKVGDDTTFINSSAVYTTSGNYLDFMTDSLGNMLDYSFNETKGTLDTLTDAKGKVTSYAYDGNTDNLLTVSKVADGQTVTNSYIYLNDRISSITHNGFSYNFGYDALGNNNTVSAGTQNLITNIYEPRTSLLQQSNYGNGQKVSSEYDSLDRVTVKKYKGTDDSVFNTRNTYQYDASGNLASNEDLVNGVSYRYIYDNADRLVTVSDSLGNNTGFGYDMNNNSKVTEKIGNSTYETNYAYDKDNRQSSVTYNRATLNTLSYNYDPVLGRLTSSKINTGAANFNTTYGYLEGTNGSKSNLVSSITNGTLGAIAYTYDANGNIETITQGSKQIEYDYNELNEVIREDNQVLNKTINYSYDAGGNITSKTEYAYTTGTLGTPTKTVSYSYGDSNWKDKLTSYDGKAVTYDAIGNPLTYDGWTYTWEEGRQLKTSAGNGHSISYKYNDAGIRTQKIVDGVTTNYHLVGDKVTYENNGTDAIYYSYDASGNIISMNLNGTEYYYVRNAQGDITGLIDCNGTQVVSYTYDTWGKLISTTGTLASTVGVKNPYRYRGYRYDTETGLYYLQSRYYNADWGRFINADSYGGTVGELLSHNVFAYCMNNPVNMEDPNGNFNLPNWAKWAIAGVAAVVVAAIVVASLPADTVAAAIALGGAIVSKVSQVTQKIVSKVANKPISNAVNKGEGNATPEIGRKLEYVFGNATGTAHNIERSVDMERQLNRIGIFDNTEGRACVQQQLEKAFNNSTNGTVQSNGRILKESLLTGSNGVVKMQSVWDGNKLITIEIFGGGK